MRRLRAGYQRGAIRGVGKKCKVDRVAATQGGPRLFFPLFLRRVALVVAVAGGALAEVWRRLPPRPAVVLVIVVRPGRPGPAAAVVRRQGVDAAVVLLLVLVHDAGPDPGLRRARRRLLDHLQDGVGTRRLDDRLAH